MEEYFKIVINVVEVAVNNTYDSMQLSTNAARLQWRLNSDRVGYVHHIGSSVLQKTYFGNLLLVDFLYICECNCLLLL